MSGYHEAGTWAGHPRWKCDLCSFDALDEQKVAEHVADYHRLTCEHCDFTATDAWQMREHAAGCHERTIIVTDAYGRPQHD